MKKSNSMQRLNEYMSTYGLKQSDIVSKTGLSKSLVSLYVNGKREPMQDNIFIISKALNVDPAWLMGYDVPMRKEVKIEEKYSNANADIIIKIQSDKQLMEFIRNFDSLDDVQKKSIMALVSSMVKK